MAFVKAGDHVVRVRDGKRYAVVWAFQLNPTARPHVEAAPINSDGSVGIERLWLGRKYREIET